MDWKIPFKEALQDYYDDRKSNSSKYSIRNLSAEVGLSIGAISSFFTGRYPLSSERAAGVLRKLNLPARRRDYLLTLMGQPVERTVDNVTIVDSGKLLNWVVQAVLHFYDLDQFDVSIANMAKRLQVSEEKITEARAVLLENGFLATEVDGQIKKREQYYKIGDGPSSADIRKSHVENLELSKQAISKVDKSRREFMYTTFSADEACFAQAREEMMKAHERISSLMDGTNSRNQVYRLTTNLFPLDFENT